MSVIATCVVAMSVIAMSVIACRAFWVQAPTPDMREVRIGSRGDV